jgi:hypothetical protein
VFFVFNQQNSPFHATKLQNKLPPPITLKRTPIIDAFQQSADIGCSYARYS